MKVVLAGGHLTPALAVLEALPKDTSVVYVGRKYALEGDKALSLEYQTISALAIPFVGLRAARLQRKLTRHTLASLLRFPAGLYRAVLILRNENPDVVVSFGGYIGFTLSLAAYLCRLPFVIHEQTMDAGLANKITGKFADAICISWNSSRRYFPAKKTRLTGNPLRKSFFQDVSGVSPDKSDPFIYVTGGSLGSHAINVLVEKSLSTLLGKFRVIHQTGDARQFGDFDRLKKARDDLPKQLAGRYTLVRFVLPHEVGPYMAQASLVISRSGINTVTELLYLGKPCLLIPLPHGQRGEQRRNASFVKEIGIGEVLEQEFLTEERFSEQVICMMENLDDFLDHSAQAHKQIPVKAAEQIVEVIERVVAKKT